MGKRAGIKPRATFIVHILMVNWLSTWQDVESPRRHTSGHAHEGLFRLGWWGVKTHPFHGLESPAEHSGEFQLRTTSIHLFLFPDCGHNVTSSCCLDSLPQWTIPSSVSQNKPLSLKSLFVTVIWKIANTQMDAGPLGHYVRLSLLLPVLPQPTPAGVRGGRGEGSLP